MSMNVSELFRGLLEQEHRNTLAVLEAIPAEQMNYTPWPGAMNARRLALHIIGLEEQFIRGVLEGELVAGGSRRDRPEVQTPADLVAFSKAQHEALGRLVAQLDEAVMDRDVPFKVPQGMVIRVAPGWEHLFSALLLHLAHHRGQLVTYLRLTGSPVPGIYGPSLGQMPPVF